MNLKQIIARLAELDEEVRNAESVEAVAKAEEEKKELLARKAELEDLEARKAAALELQGGSARGSELGLNPMMGEKRAVAVVDPASTPEYRTAYLKRLMGKELSDIEKRDIAATNVAGAIPTQTAEKIFNKVREMAPLLNEVTLLHVAGNVNFAVEGTNNSAAIHTENGELTAQDDTLVTVSLGAYEIVKLVRISKTVQTMSINAFEGWLADLLAENIANVIENYIINGTGSSEPTGIDYARTWTDTSSAVDWAAAAPTLAEIREQMGLLGGGYFRKAKWLMNHTTFWGCLQTNRDDSKHKMTERVGDKYFLMGKEVLFSDYVNDGDIFLGDFSKIVANLSQEVTIASSAESGFIYNAIDFRGSAMFDCDIAVGEAFVKGAATLTAGA